MKNKKGFTLIEILVVVLIIGILAAIAIPQYQRAVLKADLHRGISLVESLYQAQQSYYLAHGDYTTDLDDLDVSIPKDISCKKTVTNLHGVYDCDFGRIYTNKKNVQFQNKPNRDNVSLADIAYTHMITDDGDRKAGKRYCYAKTENKLANDACRELGEETDIVPTKWTYYEIK